MKGGVKVIERGVKEGAEVEEEGGEKETTREESIETCLVKRTGTTNQPTNQSDQTKYPTSRLHVLPQAHIVNQV